MGKPDRKIIIHNHLFKNAGSTFDWSLQRFFGEDFCDHRDDMKMKQGKGYLGPYLLENQNLRALSSHHLRFPLPEINNVQLFPAIILRHPIDRLGSVYNFEQRQDAETLGAIHAKKFSFTEYVRWRMNPKIPATIRNFQTTWCLDASNYPKGQLPWVIHENDFEDALKRVMHTNLIGIVDLYDECMVLFEEFLSPVFPSINLAYVKQNASSGRKKEVDERVFSTLHELGLENANYALANNNWDLKLYIAGRELVIDRMRKVDNFASKLENFQKRCLDLSIGKQNDIAANITQSV